MTLKGKDNYEKSYRFIAVLSSLIICVAAFSACGADNNSNDSSISNSSAQSSSDESSEKKTSSDDESKNDESSEDSEKNENSEEGSETTENSDSKDSSDKESSKAESSVNSEQNASNASEAQKPSESSKSTGNKDFDEVFKDNKLDILLSNDMKRADTTEAMSETLAKYEKLWLAEAENANNKLQVSSLSDEEKKAIQSDYDAWINGFQTKRKEIVKEEKSKWDSGSIYIVNAAEKIKDYCRDYAMNLYEKLYRVDGSFELAYSE